MWSAGEQFQMPIVGHVFFPSGGWVLALRASCCPSKLLGSPNGGVEQRHKSWRQETVRHEPHHEPSLTLNRSSRDVPLPNMAPRT